MNSFEILFYSSIVVLILLQVMKTYLSVNESFVTSKIIQGEENSKADLNCQVGEKIIDVDLIKYGAQSFVDGRTTGPGIENIDLKNKTICEGRESCSIFVNNAIVGTDPAPGIRKFWRVEYKCEKSVPPPVTTQIPQSPQQLPPQQLTPLQQTPIITELPSFMNQNSLLKPMSDTELQEYKLFYIIITSCAIKDTLNTKMKNKQISFKQLYRENLQKMGIEPYIFERNLDNYMIIIQKLSDRTWKEVFESALFLNIITENIQYYLLNPSQSKIDSEKRPIGTIEHVRRPIINENAFISAYNTCKTRMNSLEVYSPVSYSSRLYD